MAGALSPVPRQTFFANDGSPLSGGNIYTYAAGTLTPKTMYSDTALTVPISNPIVLNAAGRPVASAIDPTEVGLYPLTGSYKWVVKDSNGNTIWTQDNIPSIAIASGTVTSVGLSMPSLFTVANSPITSSGTLAVTNAANVAVGRCHGRLTLTPGVAVTTGDVTAATTVYFTPYGGNIIDLFDGVSVWNSRAFAELSMPLGTLTAALPYDLFCYDNGGVATLRAPVAWTSTTTRATALTLQNGIYVKTGATTDRYLGTFYTTATTTTEDSAAKRFLWNYYNRTTRQCQGPTEGTDSWTYSLATVRQANGSATNQFEVVIGVAEVMVAVDVLGAATSGGAADFTKNGIGEDSTSAYVAGSFRSITQTATITSLHSSLRKYPAVGYHKYTWLESSDTTGTTTFYGDNSSTLQSGISGWLGT